MASIVETPDDSAYFARSDGREWDPKIRARQTMERAVIRHACTALIAAGCYLRVDNGEELVTPHTNKLNEVMDAIMQTDEEHIHVYKRHGVVHKKHGFEFNKLGWIFLVYGNAGWEVIADHTVSLGELLASTDAYTDQLADGL